MLFNSTKQKYEHITHLPGYLSALVWTGCFNCQHLYIIPFKEIFFFAQGLLASLNIQNDIDY
jgi:hypothetical protein